MSLQRFLVQCAAAAGLTGCVAATPVESTSIDAQYHVGGGTWNTGGGITTAVRVFERGGNTAVCGAWTIDRQSVLSSELNRTVIEAASIYIGGDRVAQNLSFMQRVPYSGNIVGQQANCVVSDRPWKAAYETLVPVVRIPRLSFPLDVDQGSANAVTFRQSERADIVH